MRKEFILVLLGIICVSTLSSLLARNVEIESDKVLLDTVKGTVGAGNFSYWQLGHAGRLLVELTSLSGDADLYVSDTIKPGYELDRNNFSSATCGHDVVGVPADFPRPIGIGVFGHWSHLESVYNIHVYLDTSAEAFFGEEWPFLDTEPEQETFDISDLEWWRNEGPEPANFIVEPKTTFLKLLSVLNMIFEMFVL